MRLHIFSGVSTINIIPHFHSFSCFFNSSTRTCMCTNKDGFQRKLTLFKKMNKSKIVLKEKKRKHFSNEMEWREKKASHTHVCVYFHILVCSCNATRHAMSRQCIFVYMSRFQLLCRLSYTYYIQCLMQTICMPHTSCYCMFCSSDEHAFHYYRFRAPHRTYESRFFSGFLSSLALFAFVHA